MSLPAVYDFADMGLDNLIGWDFVKLETELKVRILPLLVKGPESKFLSQVLKFERYLAAATNALHDQKDAPTAEFESQGVNDLAAILLSIRRQGQRHLGLQRQRDRKWLVEYYESAKRAAEAVLRSLEGPTQPEEQVWVSATQADARLLLGQNEEAERLYRQARSLSSPRSVATMLRQVKLLLAYAPDPSPITEYWTAGRLAAVFGP